MWASSMRQQLYNKIHSSGKGVQCSCFSILLFCVMFGYCCSTSPYCKQGVFCAVYLWNFIAALVSLSFFMYHKIMSTYLLVPIQQSQRGFRFAHFPSVSWSVCPPVHSSVLQISFPDFFLHILS